LRYHLNPGANHGDYLPGKIALEIRALKSRKSREQLAGKSVSLLRLRICWDSSFSRQSHRIKTSSVISFLRVQRYQKKAKSYADFNQFQIKAICGK
jgi:hypothetical protein